MLHIAPYSTESTQAFFYFSLLTVDSCYNMFLPRISTCFEENTPWVPMLNVLMEKKLYYHSKLNNMVL